MGTEKFGILEEAIENTNQMDAEVGNKFNSKKFDGCNITDD